jgi:hypothetical protein
MRQTPPPSFGEDPTTEETIAPYIGSLPRPRAAETEHLQRALAPARQREQTIPSTVVLTLAENRTLTKLCTQASVDVGPPAVDSAEVLRALMRVMHSSEELQHWVRDELARSRCATKPGGGLADDPGPPSMAVDGGGPTYAPVVVLSRRGRHRAPAQR